MMNYNDVRQSSKHCVVLLYITCTYVDFVLTVSRDLVHVTPPESLANMHIQSEPNAVLRAAQLE